ncbi:MAG: ABC transporter ATP-binding protein [Nitrososphaerota archaeon]|nr:ABC transporter ATP-binding protein [Nitrososphaerota archaeon]
MFSAKKYVKAVDGISIEMGQGETLALVGESGCGKTTTARSIVRLARPTGGKIYVGGIDIALLSGRELKKYRRMVQYIFQDPYESLNPRQTIFDAIATPIRIHKLVPDKQSLQRRVSELLESVNLEPKQVADKYPFQLSGGQRQRVNIARALATRPELIIADEPVSMLDVSLRTGVLQLLEKLKREYGLTFIIITHDMAVARQVSDRIAVMYLGKIVEIGTSTEVIDHPIHPYTRMLLAATPELERTKVERKTGVSVEEGTIGSAMNLPTGCRFHPRCKYAIEKCRKSEPSLLARTSNHLAACDVVSI